MPCLFLVALASIDKEVVHTPWWPPGSEATAESVGIVSRGRIFMTAMMELKETDEKAVDAELSDVADISIAAGTNLSGLVSCLVNAPANQSARIRGLFTSSTTWPQHIALTVVEMVGEYSGTFPFQLQCTGVQPALHPIRVLAHGTRSRAVEAGGIAELSVRAPSVSAALTAIKELVNGELDALLSCTAFVRSGAEGATDAAELHDALRVTTVPVALTMLHAPTEDDEDESSGALLSLACTALAERPASGEVSGVSAPGGGYAVVDRKHGLIFTSGLRIADANSTGAFGNLGALLDAAGSDLELLLACRFYLGVLPAAGYPAQLFAGFQRTFCEAHPPPPTRAEYVAPGVGHSSDHASGLIAQCTAALPSRRALAADPFG